MALVFHHPAKQILPSPALKDYFCSGSISEIIFKFHVNSLEQKWNTDFLVFSLLAI